MANILLLNPSPKYAPITHLACGVTSSDADVGDGKRSTSTFGSALMAASRTLGRRCSGGEGEMGGGGGEHGDSGSIGAGLAGGGVRDSRSGLVETMVVFCATGGSDAADTTCTGQHIVTRAYCGGLIGCMTVRGPLVLRGRRRKKGRERRLKQKTFLLHPTFSRTSECSP